MTVPFEGLSRTTEHRCRPECDSGSRREGPCPSSGSDVSTGEVGTDGSGGTSRGQGGG